MKLVILYSIFGSVSVLFEKQKSTYDIFIHTHDMYMRAVIRGMFMWRLGHGP